MRTVFKTLFLSAFLIFSSAVAETAVSEMVFAANTFLNSLNEEQRARASFDFENDERFDWHFIPKKRKGLPITEMESAQITLAYALLSTGTSRSGQLKAMTIMTLEKILQDIEGPTRRFSRDPALYHISIFGNPSKKGTWGWRFEGHHLSLNYTIVKGKLVSGTPSFYGTNPAKVRSGSHQGLRVLGLEEDIARRLVKSLLPNQRQVAIVAEKAPRDIFTAAERKIIPLKHKGIQWVSLDEDQRELLMKIIRQYAFRNRPELAEKDLDEIDRAGIEKITFAWMGGIEVGEAHYYSIQGPSFVLEYDNIQNDANHVHATWRSFDGDFGIDLLKDHYETFPH